MKIGKKLAVMLLFLSVMAGTASAQTPEKLIQNIMLDARGACVTVTYALSAEVDNVKIEDEGSVVAQDELWLLKGRSVDVYTNAEGTWVLSPEDMEAVVEPKWTYGDLEAFYKAMLSAASGNNVSVKILSRTVSDKKPESYFKPVTGDDWVVTDLR